MGGSVSAGKNNDELIDHLVEAEFIKTPLVQRVFRAVDRGDYFLPNHKQNAYKDIAWKMDSLHLSAPCVYSVVMEALKLRAGLSFLNLGSGTGYLSTMAGLVLGPYGINHGVELNSDIIDFAYERLGDFLKNSPAIDEFDFCEPTFTFGDCLKLDNTCQKYDRVYCGASCPAEYEPFLKNLIKVGGILIMPSNEKLLKITRPSETTWNTVKVLSVSFAPLVTPKPSKEPIETVKLGDISPPTLQHLCRSSIRTVLRGFVDDEHPNLKLRLLKMEPWPKRQMQRIVIPFYDSDISNSNSGENTEVEYDSDGPELTISSRLPSRMSVFLEDFLQRHTDLQLLRDMHGEISSDSDAPGPSNPPILPNANEVERSETEPENEPSAVFSLSNWAGISGTEPGNQPPSTVYSLITVSNLRQSSLLSDESNNPPSQSTRSSRQKRLLKRKQAHSLEKKTTKPSDNSEAGTSSEVAGEPKKKMKSSEAAKKPKRKRCKAIGKPKKKKKSSKVAGNPKKKIKRPAASVGWKKLVDKEKSESKEEEVSEVGNYSEFMVKRIGGLPLPSALLRYVNYKRENL